MIEPGYRAVVARRNARFDSGRGVITIDRPVISIGNLSVGGTGKTPMVQHILRTLAEDGRSPAVAMRGYKAGPGGVSDEHRLHAESFPEVPVVARPDRLHGLLLLFSTETGRAVDCVVLDDGFQHRRIARQLDVLLIDAAAATPEGRCLPAGLLREPFENASRASCVVLTHTDALGPGELDRLRDEIESRSGVAVVAETRHAWSGLDVYERGEDREMPPAKIAGRRVVAVCAIGSPERFLAQLESAGAHLVERIVRPDHDPFGARALAQIDRACRGARPDFVVTTAKDWGKLAGAGVRWAAPVARPRLEIAFARGRDAFDDLVRRAAALDPDGPPIRAPAADRAGGGR